MKKKTWSRTFNIGLIFILMLSILAPIHPNSAKAADAITVSEAIANNTGTAAVEGYIVGVTNSGPSYTHNGPFTVATNLAIADSPDETDASKILPVQLPKNDIRTELNLVDHPENLGKKVQITGSLEAYFGAPGLKSPSSYAFVSETDPTKVQPVTAAPAAGAVASGTEVTLATATPDAKIFYTTDGSEPTSASTEYTGPVTIEEAQTIKAVATADGLDNSDVQTFDYTILQAETISEVRKKEVDSTVMTTGIVTATLGSTVYIQDDNAGIVLYGYDLDVERGDKVRAKGTLTEYSSLLEINVEASDVEVIEKVNVPSPLVLNASELTEEKEGMLVTLEEVSIDSFVGGNYIAKDSQGTEIQIRPQDAALLSTGVTYESITGVVGAYNDTYQLIPRDAADIIQDSSVVQTPIATPGAGLVNSGDAVTLSSQTDGATIYYTTDNSEPTTASNVYSEPITISENTTIKAIAVKNGLTNSKVAVFEYIIQDGDIRIHDIQGAKHTSLLENSNVTGVEGIVTHVVNNSEFYMQDLQPDNDPKTSEGILVYKSSHGVEVGDVVEVTGEVKEYVMDGYGERFTTDLTFTELSASTVTTTASDQELPAPIVIGKDRALPTEIIDNDGFATFDPDEDGIDFFESLEGMLVAVENPKVVAPPKYGEVIVVPENVETNTDAGGLKISETDYNPERIAIDIDDESFVAKTGDHFNGSIAGVVSYNYSNYKVLTDKNELPELVKGETTRDTTTISADSGKLTIASYNVENFSSKTDDAKVTKLAKAIVESLKQPDIIGLTEMQDNNGETDDGTTASDESFQTLIAKISELGGPTYAYTDIAPEDKQDGGVPGGNIRVGFLYNKDRVSLAEGTKGTATQSVGFENGSLTLNPGRIDPTNPAFNDSRKPLAAQFEFNGEPIIVVANHFNSKGGDLPLFGKVQPPVLGSEEQRMEIATIVNNFVKDIKTKDPDANIVLTGDFNDFVFSNPLKTLKGNELTNMIEKVPATERYSYTYQGNSQVLDHILVSNNLAESTAVDIVHINSSFTEAEGRASDHDPVLIQVALKNNAQQPTPAPENLKKYTFKNVNSNKINVTSKYAEIDLVQNVTLRKGLHLIGARYASLKGNALKDVTVYIKPTKPNAIINFNGTTVENIVIDGTNVKEIQGAKNIKNIKLKKGANLEDITFFTSEGELISSSSFLISSHYHEPLYYYLFQNKKERRIPHFS
ncbi:chitobiase/beta-hexosaminidase C-terminal domain-containing protein [Bacillus seohaeanensis]|uniref:Chitobiase/beta-hexosaminidase C-terminal domain-containing protein n=1 Tax=Bacillus seohaeanensis TaxID=284580 RepID=A0ABW5S090_9BACI